MRQYKIYLIEEEFAAHYFGCEAKIYQLFSEHNQINSAKKKLLQKQIQFITKKIPIMFINQIVESKLKNRKDYVKQQNDHYIQMNNNRSQAKLTVSDHYITLHASGTYEAETMFFEILRKYSSCFLAMDFRLNKYGWLNPVKERKFV